MKNGNSIITVPIMLVFSIIVISSISVLLINILKPYIMYEKLLSTTLRYMFVLEEYGYMTANDKEMLIEELVNQGFDKEKLVVNATQTLQSYGDTVYLSVTYYYTLDIPMVNNSLVIDNRKQTSTMNVIKYGISKR